MENKFEWDDALVKEFGTFILIEEYKNKGNHGLVWDKVNDFKKSKGFTPTVERDFEILQGCSPFGEPHPWLKEDNMFGSKPCETEGCKIYSVRRLSDNSVWTVSEVVNGKTIEKFFDGWNGMEVHYTDGSAILLSLITKITPKKILGTTHDGKICYDGDDFPIYGLDTTLGLTFVTNTQTCSWDERAVFFANEKALREYVLLNKPCLSLNDILSVWDEGENPSYYRNAPLFQKIEAKAKSKINQP